MTLVSLVIPTHNEAQNIALLHQRIVETFKTLSSYDFELIFIDDSLDDTPAIIKQCREADRRVKLIRLTRSFGQAIALAAGLKAAKGQAIIMMDADLQDPPECIPQLLERWEHGYKLVYVERSSSDRSLIYKFCAKFFYRLLKKISYISIPIDAGEFRLLDRKIVDFLNGLKEHSRFMRGLTVWPGWPTDRIVICRAERAHGQTNYNFKRSLGVALDGFISFSTIPLRIATGLGFMLSILSMLGGFIYFICWLFKLYEFGSGWTSLFLSGVFIGSLNLMCLGIIGEYLGRCFTELQGRPLYLIDYSIGLDSEDSEHHE